jgi:transglutaminase-like putative cysteine protease
MRRSPVWAGLLASLVLVGGLGRDAPAAPSSAEEAGPVRRKGSYWFFVENITIDRERQRRAKDPPRPRVRLWAALPIERRGQRVRVGAIEPRPEGILEDSETGNRVVLWDVRRPPEGGSLVFRYDFEVESRRVSFELDPKRVVRPAPASKEVTRFTISEPWLEASEAISARAREIVGRESNPLLQAQKVFDWVVSQMTYDYPAVEDRGVQKAWARMKGDCGEYSHVFIAMMRALGVPARLVTAVWFQGSGHAWAEVFLPPYGWVPADTSGAQLVQNGLKGQLTEAKVKEFMATRGIPTRDPRWLLGHLYPNRLEVFIGENVQLYLHGQPRGRFSFMQPGGDNAWPRAVELLGLSRETVTAGFYLFGDDANDEKKARERAEEELAPGYLKAKLFARALPGLRKGVARSPRSATASFQLGQALFGLLQWDPALAAFRAALAGQGGSTKPTTDTWAHLFIGMCEDAKGDRAAAVRSYRKALSVGAEYGGARALAEKLIKAPFRPDPAPKDKTAAPHP